MGNSLSDKCYQTFIHNIIVCCDTAHATGMLKDLTPEKISILSHCLKLSVLCDSYKAGQFLVTH